MYGRVIQGSVVSLGLIFSWLYHYLTIVTIIFAIVSLINIVKSIQVNRHPDPDWL
ncbi:hypothetical protein H9L19_03850 [Weissella diestrammenae]|uniref:Uncharacterized protein n=1 Tax=Weissella diestrammenae TaxID=1162633 RepID=A0A7G9T7B7_9LACO|nr:hypothetical protein [Weissella diestrammenae]MCM0582004.1 hypothetical protein [Weissella diestrammenae]QNN75992.1 hypothetical protein H9L19_03850 [Weissella diestrammenae]